MGRRRYIYIIREPSNVDHVTTRQCRGYEYEPEAGEGEGLELDWIYGDVAELCPKCRWFACRRMRYDEKPEASSVALWYTLVTLRELSDWWIGNHIEYIGKKDYRYDQNHSCVTERMEAQGTPIRPSDIAQWEESQELVALIREEAEQEQGLRILIDMDRL